MLVISILLVLIPLAGLVYILLQGPALTVDTLFTGIILLTMSGVFAVNALLELKERRGGGKASNPGPGRERARPQMAALPADPAARHARGVVESVEFFEAHTGNVNQSIVTLRDLATGSRQMLSLVGNLRDQLIPGRTVEIAYRPGKPAGIMLERTEE